MGDVVKQTIEIAAPIERVWELVMDPERLGEWVTIHEEAYDYPDADLETGSRFGQRMKLKGVPLKVRWEVTECDPPHRARWNGTAAAGSKARIAYDLSESDGGTVFDYENEFDLPAGKVGKLAGRAFNAMSGEREAKKSLQRLKDLLEDG
ncbi:MAG: SRPBCC family protein [Solirubrobacterales bacterium]|nr:SRPBCC family protein [Solirubrobacterales bacterium]MCO5327271.1 SRPBCC family protein [Solirubrobacterales bacterium]